MPDTEWIEIGRVVGDTGPKGDMVTHSHMMISHQNNWQL